MTPPKPFTRLQREVLVQNPWHRYCKDRYIQADGSEGVYYYIDMPGSCAAIPVFDDGSTVLVRVHRYLLGGDFYEFPIGGMLPGEDALTVAQKELHEEAGLTARHWTPLGRFAPYKGVSNEVCHFWLARGLTETAQHLEPSEQISVHRMPFAEARARLVDQDCADGQSLAGLLLLDRWLQGQHAVTNPFRVTVYASSSERIDRAHFAIAEDLGRRIAARGWELVFGGGRYGLMGAVSRGARAAGGSLRGVILQEFVDKNVHCTETRDMASVTDMRTRKRGLDEAGDAYVALPGGLGTLEEVLEILSFKQLGFHHKPVVLLNALGYWDPLLQMLEQGFAQGFIQSHFRGIYTVAADAAAAIAAIDAGRTAIA